MPLAALRIPASASGVPRIFVYLTFASLFCYISRLQELLPQLHTNYIFIFLLIPGFIYPGRLSIAFSSRVAKLRIAFFIWMTFTIPFSAWRGGAILEVANSLKVAPIIIALYAFLETRRDFTAAMRTIALAVSFSAGTALLTGDAVMGRAIMSRDSGTLNDPNYLCLYILAGMPALYTWYRSASFAGKVLSAVLSIMILSVAVKTQSRGGAIAFVIAVIFLLIKLPMKGRLLLVLGIGIASLFGALYVPTSTWSRLNSIFGASNSLTSDDSLATEAATDSAASRKRLLTQSLILTYRHPFLGVGAGSFQTAEASLAAETGRRGMWHATHNTYTQVSAELGLPALALYLAALLSCWSILRKIRANPPRSAEADFRGTALCLQTGLVLFAISAGSLTFSYVSIQDVFFALTVVLERASHLTFDGRSPSEQYVRVRA
jgi:O-antigen ligase